MAVVAKKANEIGASLMLMMKLEEYVLNSSQILKGYSTLWLQWLENVDSEREK